jgi:hypothetical protein
MSFIIKKYLKNMELTKYFGFLRKQLHEKKTKICVFRF